MKRIVFTTMLFALLVSVAGSQVIQPPEPDPLQSRFALPHGQTASATMPLRSYMIPGKRASQYTTEDWKQVIDSTWGPGQSATEQLLIFDTFWNSIDQRWPGFPNLSLDWDSVRSAHRPQIGTGLSRGGFYSLMSRMWLALMELHTKITDDNIEAVYNEPGAYNTFRYRRGFPLLVLGAWGYSPLGAAVTMLPDSTTFVYSAAPGNPLDLEPGDIVLGYEGVPWKRLSQDLLNAGLPVSSKYSCVGSTTESSAYALLASVGWNWGMFDTVDVVKYSSGDTLHLPTASLTAFPQAFPATDQIPVPGVPMPETPPHGDKAVSHGIVQGTNVGYIYVYDWYSDATSRLFSEAIHDLCFIKNVAGLVIDSRLNTGGTTELANAGFSQIFNVDPGANYDFASRNSISDHMSFVFSKPDDGFAAGRYVYDRPIAVLVGPGSWSAGDANAFRLSCHPMARFFGKRTNGAFVRSPVTAESFSDAWSYRYFDQTRYSRRPGEGFLMHKSFPIDEEIWLTRDGASKGEDDVVKRAVEWITNLAYAHHVVPASSYVRAGVDSLIVSAVLTNPNGHSITPSFTLSNSAGVDLDSVVMMNDGLHGDCLPGDSVWGARVCTPLAEDFYAITVRTVDHTLGSSRVLPRAGFFTTAGPVACVGDTSDKIPAWGQAVRFKFKLQNLGNTAEVRGLAVRVCSLDTSAVCANTVLQYTALLPGQSSYGSSLQMIGFSRWGHGTQDIPLEFRIANGGMEFWRDTFSVRVTDPVGTAGQEEIPAEFALEQNYPNPFNPTTTIRYSLPPRNNSQAGGNDGAGYATTITVYDLLGRKVATLVDENKTAGAYSVQFDATGLASGMYLYRMTAGTFAATRTLVVLH